MFKFFSRKWKIEKKIPKHKNLTLTLAGRCHHRRRWIRISRHRCQRIRACGGRIPRLPPDTGGGELPLAFRSSPSPDERVGWQGRAAAGLPLKPAARSAREGQGSRRLRRRPRHLPPVAWPPKADLTATEPSACRRPGPLPTARGE